MTCNKIALGTVQFGLPYGVANAAGKVQHDELVRILQLAKAQGINTLDTAIAYGDSEESLGSAGVGGFELITKLPAVPDELSDADEWVNANIKASLKRLRQSSVETVLLHRASDIIGKHSKALQSALQALKDSGLCRAVGVSIYSPSDLDAIWQHHSQWRPDLIQAPLNVLDRRLINSGWLTKLQVENVRVHIRSVFLQGLLLMPANNRPEWFMQWTPLLNDWLDWCKQNKITPLHAALQWVVSQQGIEKVVVGVDNALQLGEILDNMRAQTLSNFESNSFKSYSEDPRLIDPSQWKLA